MFLDSLHCTGLKSGHYMGGGEWALRGGFGAEDALEARAGELHADQALAVELCLEEQNGEIGSLELVGIQQISV